MKLNAIETIIAIAISLLLTYGMYYFHNIGNKMLLSAGSFMFLSITLIITIAATFELPRTTTNIKVISGIFFVIALISNIIFTFINFSVPVYIITNGVGLLAFILIIFSINKAKQ